MIDDPSRESPSEQFEDLEIFSVNQSMDWWPDLSDLDRLNVLSNPTEDRARVLAAKVSLTVEETMEAMSKYSDIPLV